MLLQTMESFQREIYEFTSSNHTEDDIQSILKKSLNLLYKIADKLNFVGCSDKISTRETLMKVEVIKIHIDSLYCTLRAQLDLDEGNITVSNCKKIAESMINTFESNLASSNNIFDSISRVSNVPRQCYQQYELRASKRFINNIDDNYVFVRSGEDLSDNQELRKNTENKTTKSKEREMKNSSELEVGIDFKDNEELRHNEDSTLEEDVDKDTDSWSEIDDVSTKSSLGIGKNVQTEIDEIFNNTTGITSQLIDSTNKNETNSEMECTESNNDMNDDLKQKKSMQTITNTIHKVEVQGDVETSTNDLLNCLKNNANTAQTKEVAKKKMKKKMLKKKARAKTKKGETKTMIENKVENIINDEDFTKIFRKCNLVSTVNLKPMSICEKNFIGKTKISKTSEELIQWTNKDRRNQIMRALLFSANFSFPSPDITVLSDDIAIVERHQATDDIYHSIKGWNTIVSFSRQVYYCCCCGLTIIGDYDLQTHLQPESRHYVALHSSELVFVRHKYDFYRKVKNNLIHCSICEEVYDASYFDNLHVNHDDNYSKARQKVPKGSDKFPEAHLG